MISLEEQCIKFEVPVNVYRWKHKRRKYIFLKKSYIKKGSGIDNVTQVVVWIGTIIKTLFSVKVKKKHT